ncbi:MAG: methyltransferase domain-containing protein, partial [bacterium]|nr:methyltransferase domain-containing protein [bacterium]
RSYPNYQPVFLGGKIVTGSDRNCQDRWLMIKAVIQDLSCKSLIDIGCAEGFYVLQAARECGVVSLGIDSDPRRLSVAQAQLTVECIMPAGFLLGDVDQEFLAKLPRYDLAVFMSVLHHVMYAEGLEKSRELMAALRPVVGKAMIFEMGQSDEIENKWAKSLPDMGTRPHEWIRNFILNCGYSRVTKIGESDSYRKDQKRAIFKVEP